MALGGSEECQSLMESEGAAVAIRIAIEKLCLPSVQATFKLFYNILIVVCGGEMAKAGVGGRMPEKRICAGAQRLASL